MGKPLAALLLLTFLAAAELGAQAALPAPQRASPGLPDLGVANDICFLEGEVLCLQGGRYRAQVEWADFRGNRGVARAVKLTFATGYFWFFGPDNVEILLKALDGRLINGHFWIFYGSLSNVEYTITVTDVFTGARKVYFNPAGHFASRGDTQAFPAEAKCGGFAGIPCPNGGICDFPPGQCHISDNQGFCVPRPDACAEVFAPVCGCDGVTYGNDCERLIAGVAKDHDGECD